MIYNKIKQALIEKLGIEESLVSPDSYVQADLELDSTETVIIALELKKLLGVDYVFPEGDVTLAQIVASVNELEAVGG